MRTGACTVQQALTSEAASVLKHALSLARRRGHAQVTPLHVAATLLSSSREATSLFRRACLRSHPHHRTAHPLQCRALELCFNVALNRLPTTPPPSSGPLIPTTPTLSNALIAALKRAQAHQRRGCIEQQQQQQQPQPQQQQPLLAIKVELEQLVISILDDPSVSRVMREAGFSSTCVKKNLEEDSSPSVLFDIYHHRDIVSPSSFWQTYFLRPPVERNPLISSISSSSQEDLRLVLQVFLGKNQRRSNAVVVGDSVSYAEGLVAELMAMVQRGEVPDELRSAQFVKFQLSSSNLKLMNRSEVEMTVSDLRRKVGSLASGRGGVIIYVSDLKWAVDEEAKDGEAPQESGYRAVDHVVAEVGRLLSELKGCSHGDVSSCSGNSGSKVWLMATANYQTYMRCKVAQPSLESQWALQPVSVPSGGLALSLHSQSGRDVRMTTISQNHLHMLEPKHFSPNDEQDKLVCCAECAASFEREASMFKSDHNAASALQFRSSEAKDGSTNLPSWLQPHRPDNHQKDVLLELRRKWNKLCQSLRHDRHPQTHQYPPLFDRTPPGKSFTHGSSHPWWPSGTHCSSSDSFTDLSPLSFTDLWSRPSGGSSNFPAQLRSRIGSCHERETTKLSLSEVSLDSLKRTGFPDACTALALGGAADQKKEEPVDLLGLWRRLKENIPWQPELARSVAEALHNQRSDGKKGAWLLIRGTDEVGKRRLPRAIAESLCGSVDRLVQINARKSLVKPHCEVVMEALKQDADCVISIEEIDWRDASLSEFLAEVFEKGYTRDPTGRVVSSSHAIFVLAAGSHNKCGNAVGSCPDTVIKLRLETEAASTEVVKSQDLKRKAESNSPTPSKPKNQRTRENVLDLNVSAEELDDGGDEEEVGTVPSDLTQETESGEHWVPEGFLGTIGAHFVMDACPDRARRASEHLLSKLNKSFDEADGEGGAGRGSSFSVDQAAAEALAAASGSFLDNVFDDWLREVFRSSVETARKAGKVTLRVESEEGTVAEAGFQGSALPRRIAVD